MFLELSWLANYLQIIFINLVLSADNVVVIGMAAAGLSPGMRAKAIAVGIVAATLIRVAFSVVAVHLLAITGLLLAGGLLLLWVCWKMFEELRASTTAESAELGAHGSGENTPQKSFAQAVTLIVIADVSMSLDNVLAVAGAANGNIVALIFGLVLSVALMGLAAAQIAKLLTRYHWISWIGLAIIGYVAANMIYHGALDLLA